MLSLVYCEYMVYTGETNALPVSFLGWSVLSFLIPKKIHRSQKSKDPEILISEIPGGANDVCSTNGAGFLEMFVGRPPSHFLVVFPPLEVQGWISSPKNP